MLADRFQPGDIALRKVLYTLLVARLTVHDIDDIRVTYRLHDPAVAAAAIRAGTKPPAGAADMAEPTAAFASRRNVWS